MSNLFKKCRLDAQSIGEKNCCSPIAVSIATDTPIHEVLDFYYKLGRRPRGSSKQEWMEIAIHYFGKKVKKVQFNAKTVRTLARQIDDKTYIARVNGHVLCIKNGEVHDWTNGRCHRIISLYEVY